MAARPIPSESDVLIAFADAMSAAGFSPGRIEADTDKFVRFAAPGDTGKKRNGFYKLKTGRFPIGWYGDWRSGEQNEWTLDNPKELSEIELAALKRERARMKAEAAQAREQREAEAAEDASDYWKRATADVGGHPYLERKGIEDPRSLRVFTAKDGTKLIAVPMMAFDMNGQAQLTNLQFIGPDGEKRFMKGGRVDGCFHFIKGDPALTVVCEGVATGFSIWQATGLSVIVAFNAGNLIPVIREYRRNRPLAVLLIAGDDDVYPSAAWLEENEKRENPREWVNAGRVKAMEAARIGECRYILPVFSEGPARGRTDFNDLHLLEGKQAVSGQVVGAMRSAEAEDVAPGQAVIEPDKLQDESWRSGIPTTSNGSYDGNNIEGVACMIQHHPLLCGRLRFNLFTKEMELDGNALEGYHVAQFRRLMHAERLKARKPDVQDEMEGEARRNGYDPLTEYLAGLKWDGVPRVDKWTSRYLGTKDDDYTRVVGRKFLISAAARAIEPGCKVDTMPVLEGDQGTGKSTAIRYLFGDRWFTDNLPDFHSKDSFQQLQGAWCIEVAELSAMTKAEVKDVKQFLSRLVDKFRAPYERLPLMIPRRSVFVGTVNPEDGGYLRDPTGARRFWPLECGEIDLPGILSDRNQLWAEAVHLYRNGADWHLVDEEVDQAREEQEKRREIHPWETAIREYARSQSKDEITVVEALTNAIKVPLDKQTPQLGRQVGGILRGMGWLPDPARRINGVPTKVFVRRVSDEERKLAARSFEELAYGDDDGR